MFAQKLKDLRSKKHVTQQEIADFLGISRPAYTAYESGKRQPDYDILKKLATYFNVTTDFLLGQNQTPEWADKRDTTDLKKFLDDDTGMTYDGDNLTEEENEQLRVALTQIFWKRRRAERKITRDTKE
ncbi:helix-turn-helix transcriptional regulator [Loigolactobacillus coryniformis]|uniref:helix-turn-helix domain-containing protein n=1 Tax=Loigolactobacillus TaxID=2767889 RepID=UPI000F7414C1|nr:helix-turn-helix transcriptional regulator [Loigolactobacillus zhaoyuanensis]